MNLDVYLKFLPFETSTEELTIFSACLSVAFAVIVTALPFVEKRPNSKRLKALRDKRTDLMDQATKAKRRGLSEKGHGLASKMVTKTKLLGGQTAETAKMKLAAAGYRSREAMINYLFLKVCLPATFAIGAVIALYGLNLYDLSDNGKLITSLLLVIIGAFAPDIYVKNQTDKRRQLLIKSIPDALDLMVICTESGLNLDAALMRAAREIRLTSPELSDELELTSIELGFMSERRIALENFAKRTGIPSVEALTSTLIQAEKYGTPLSASLRVLANEMRDERLMKAEEKAARLPATLTVPMVIFIMPSLFIVLIGPGILGAIDAFSKL
ncbi:type II secretion system F family protein [Kiloniella sp. b19]|uniref:type II secretion system F family protein n=1 Tax=Kiloniella sp. GXU_MW_B19 TaxID=3141326 RepID=UPI0031E42DD0